jgi:hypothetical protein
MTPRLPRPSRAEETALFRHAILGDLLARDLERGELQDELKARAQLRYRPPGAPVCLATAAPLIPMLRRKEYRFVRQPWVRCSLELVWRLECAP